MTSYAIETECHCKPGDAYACQIHSTDAARRAAAWQYRCELTEARLGTLPVSGVPAEQSGDDPGGDECGRAFLRGIRYALNYPKEAHVRVGLHSLAAPADSETEPSDCLADGCDAVGCPGHTLSEFDPRDPCGDPACCASLSASDRGRIRHEGPGDSCECADGGCGPGEGCRKFTSRKVTP